MTMTLEKFNDFFNENAPAFIDAPTTPASEQNLEYWEMFQRYLRLYESTLSDYINSLDSNVDEFFDQLSAINNDPNIKDKKLVHFVNYLVAYCD